ncbi:DsbA family protein [Paenibacillus sp. GCM10012307]|uniref:DsbA family protein n=1 Tax=Paenibacillus roseus TaxID=2798579 RepID=A0A934IVU4_9BACL|nr:DsbA family protein [Paenibacillus roseus]MBJ6360241.1 DsbA family protein [Paenibacillus roseus]
MQKKNKNSRSLVIYTLVIIVIFGALFALNQAGKGKENANLTVEESPSISGQPVAGNADAKVSIVEFGDYKCPSCKVWGEQIFPKLKSDYIDTGIVSFSYINTLFHGEESKLAAQASETVYMNNPERFWDFHKALFDEQPAQTKHDDLWVTESKVLEVAQATIPGLDVEKFKQGLTSNPIQEKLDHDQLLVDKFNIQQTPTIMVNNIVIANPFDYEAIRKAIEQETN